MPIHSAQNYTWDIFLKVTHEHSLCLNIQKQINKKMDIENR
jgi:hypothetical protein